MMIIRKISVFLCEFYRELYLRLASGLKFLEVFGVPVWRLMSGDIFYGLNMR